MLTSWIHDLLNHIGPSEVRALPVRRCSRAAPEFAEMAKNLIGKCFQKKL
jgi:hypothetical protein